jgi:glutathione S-transferase
MGEAPVLIHGTKKLSQSGVILTYLAERSGKFLPRSEDERLEALRWIIFDNQKIGGALGPFRFLRNFAKPPGHPAVMDFLKGRADSALAIFDKRLSRGPYILGAGPTIADISLTSYLYYPADEFGANVSVHALFGRILDCRVRECGVRGSLEGTRRWRGTRFSDR